MSKPAILSRGKRSQIQAYNERNRNSRRTNRASYVPGNAHDLSALIALICGVIVLFVCASCGLGLYLLPVAAIVLGVIGLMMAKNAVNPQRASALVMVGTGYGHHHSPPGHHGYRCIHHTDIRICQSLGILKTGTTQPITQTNHQSIHSTLSTFMEDVQRAVVGFTTILAHQIGDPAQNQAPDVITGCDPGDRSRFPVTGDCSIASCNASTSSGTRSRSPESNKPVWTGKG